MITTPSTTTILPSIPKSSAHPKFTFELVQISRGIAALMVIGYHCASATQAAFKVTPAKGIFSLGLFGVDFFFVLSGFIITYIHLADLRQQKNLGPFAKKRFFRIYPIYWLAALLTFAYVLLVEKGRLEYTGHVLQWANVNDWLYMIKSFLLFPQPAISLVDVSWTLSFEILFYLVFGVAIFSGWKFARILFFVWIALILANGFQVFQSDNFYLNFVLNPLVIEFLMGCLLAYIFRTQAVVLTLPLFLVLAGAFGIGAILWLKVFHHQLGREGFNYILIVGGALLALWTCATIDRSRRLSKINLSPLLLLGDASYSIYLTHTLFIRILFNFATRIFKDQTLSGLQANLLFCGIGLSTALIGIAVHLSIEKPLLNYTNNRFVPGRKTLA